jgi:hypothetical protein
MPTYEEIIEGLMFISNHFAWLGILWHLAFYLLIAALFLNWKPSNKFFATFLALPLFSVSLLAWITGNPFNGLVFALFGILLVVSGSRITDAPISTGHSWSTVFGVVVIIFGLVYPHFLETDNYFHYLYMAPTGLIPCPTLSTAIGFTILYNGFQSRKWAWFLIFPGLAYGIIGVFLLEVYLDMVLLISSIVLIVVVFQVQKNTSKYTDASLYRGKSPA